MSVFEFLFMVLVWFSLCVLAVAVVCALFVAADRLAGRFDGWCNRAGIK
jgi:hypothetical protein